MRKVDVMIHSTATTCEPYCPAYTAMADQYPLQEPQETPKPLTGGYDESRIRAAEAYAMSEMDEYGGYGRTSMNGTLLLPLCSPAPLTHTQEPEVTTSPTNLPRPPSHSCSTGSPRRGTVMAGKGSTTSCPREKARNPH